MTVLNSIALGIVTSSPMPVRMRVVNVPSSTTVPSLSATRTYSPTRSVREYIRINPLAPCPTRLAPPTVSIRPISTDMPLNASLSAPGR